MMNRQPQPLTPAQALVLTITIVGELCQNRALCPPSHWHDDMEGAPLVSDDLRAWMNERDSEADAVCMMPECWVLYDEYMREKRMRGL
jgi:hypothetical protein